MLKNNNWLKPNLIKKVLLTIYIKLNTVVWKIRTLKISIANSLGRWKFHLLTILDAEGSC